ncbi:unnamed protein product [Cylicocyclus nassatus]|uniref:Uncharacterized protein n=1 Tax=Cylicocyclus nassatus TaxID=53992 RepID=A0AA36H6M5_CYLNA|nr:unnamed protein product [Cylicocyclus nassatus]
MFLEWPKYESLRGFVQLKKSFILNKFFLTAASYRDQPNVSRDVRKSWRGVLVRCTSRLNFTAYFNEGIYLDFVEKNVPTYTPQGKFDHTEVIAEEVMRRRDILWDNANNRLPNLNARRSAAWKQVRNGVFTKCDRDMTVDQIKSYRTGTGGGVDMELERAIGRGMAMMSENDDQIAKSLGREASFCGLRSAESTVCADEPASSSQQLHAEPTCALPPDPSKDCEHSSTELYHQLSTFESETDDDEIVPPRKKPRRTQHQFLEEQREVLRMFSSVKDVSCSLPVPPETKEYPLFIPTDSASDRQDKGDLSKESLLPYTMSFYRKRMRDLRAADSGLERIDMTTDTAHRQKSRGG